MGNGNQPTPAAEITLQGTLPTQKNPAAHFRWPPRGWPMFACITNNTGTATCNERGQANKDFLQYNLTINDNAVYCLEIMSGKIGTAGTSFVPAIGIHFKAREDWLDDNHQNAVEAIHVMGQTLIPEKSDILRVILAITYIISRIDRGQAPNLKRVLKIYRLA